MAIKIKKLEARDELQNLAQAAKKRNRSAFDEMWRRCETRLFERCLYLTGDQDIAGYAMSNAAERAWKALPKFREEANVYTWLNKIAGNSALNEVERLHNASKHYDLTVEYRRALEGSLPPSAMQSFPPVDYDSDAETLKECIADLISEEDQGILRLLVEGYKYNEISQKLDMEIGTVKSRICRMRSTLKLKLHDYRYGDGNLPLVQNKHATAQPYI